MLPLIIILLLVFAWFYGDGSGKDKKGKTNVTEAASAASVSATEISVSPEITIASTPYETAGNTPKTSGIQTPDETADNTTETTGIPSPKVTTGQTPVATGIPTREMTPTIPAEHLPRISPAVTPEITKALPSLTPTPQAVVSSFHCTISIDCKTVLDHLDSLNPKMQKLIPKDGIVLSDYTVGFEGEKTVFDILKQACNENNISFEYSYVPAFKTAYIEGLADLYEFDLGDLSGWQYFVNDEYAPVGCSAFTVKDGDRISWRYTCDLGKDL